MRMNPRNQGSTNTYQGKKARDGAPILIFSGYMGNIFLSFDLFSMLVLNRLRLVDVPSLSLKGAGHSM